MAAIPNTATDSTQSKPTPRTTASRPPTWRELQAHVRSFATSLPDLCQVFSVGTSRGREDWPLLVIGHGPLKMMVVAGSHANEPIGGQTIIALTEYVLDHSAERERATWYLVSSSDPDGLLLNESWMGGTWPPTIKEFHRGFYRPAGPDQPEWTFPFDGVGPAHLPETQALMKVIDAAEPNGLVSLHFPVKFKCSDLRGYVQRGTSETAGRTSQPRPRPSLFGPVREGEQMAAA